MSWPEFGTWRALQPGDFTIDGETHHIVVVDCGDLMLPSGRLVAADPFVTLMWRNCYYRVPPGAYPVRVTIDETIEREMSLSLILAPDAEVTHEPLVPYTPDDEPLPAPEADSSYGVAVDAGTVCFVDDEAVRLGMPDTSAWGDLFENDSNASWFAIMDDPKHIRAGLANIPLPLATDGANLILSHSGWGDGFYPVIGGYDVDGRLVAVHIDLLVLA